jgi:hypothetical protein
MWLEQFHVGRRCMAKEPPMSYFHPVKREGGCLCGAVRFQVQGQPLRAGLCHCLDCRKASGSFYSAFGIWPRSHFQGTGEVGTYEGRSFCRECGARVFSLRDDEAEVMLGSLDQAPSDIAPDHEVWIERREEWLEPLPWTVQFQHDREPDAEPASEDEAPPVEQQPET